MNIIKGAIGNIATIAALIMVPSLSRAQINLNFNAVKATEEGAIGLSWNSTPNEYYEIDYADSLVDTNTGTITWKLLYEDYPSQGTNTIWLDTGNYDIEPAVEHPSKSPVRFYRIALSGTNTANPPFVSITSLTNGFSASDTINVTVSARSDLAFLYTKLYVDGQEMQEASTVTNYTSNGTNFVLATYVINTCEWPNGPHTLFGTAVCQSGPTGTHDTPEPSIGRGVSAFVPGTFDNLITRVAFSQPFFTPEDGQTQHVSAVFAVNVDWTLQIQNAASNTVRTTTGSGAKMGFDWDGIGTGGVSLPVGNYTYLISAQTNGLPMPLEEPPTGTNNPPPAPMSQSLCADGSSTTDWFPTSAREALSAGWDYYFIPPPPMPPVRTNGVWMDWEDVFGPTPWFQMQASSLTRQLDSQRLSASTLDGFLQSGYGTSAYSSSSQSTRTPVRPPTAPTRGRAGFFGIAYNTYRGVASGYSLLSPVNGLPGIPTPPRLQLEGHSSGQSRFTYTALLAHIAEARGFIKEMKRGSWAMSFNRSDDALAISDLRGSGANIFNNVKLGYLMLHGTYGTSDDFTANACQQMYFPITSGSSANYLRLSEMNLGNSDTNGLKWMAINACNSLRQQNWFNMINAGVLPYNNNLHLLLGTDSISWTDRYLSGYWARYMTRGKVVLTPMTIQDAWLTAARDAYTQSGFNYTNEIFFAIAGDAACQDDMLHTNSAPTGSPYYSSVQVWP